MERLTACLVIPVAGAGLSDQPPQLRILRHRPEIALRSPLPSGYHCRLRPGLRLRFGALVVVDPRGETLTERIGWSSGLPDTDPLVFLDLQPLAGLDLPRRVLPLPAVDEQLLLNLDPRVLSLTATVR